MIAQETIDAVRRIPILTVMGERLPLERRGVSHVAPCPFHRGTDQSLHVDATRGYFYCFGCQASGNAIAFVQQMDGLTFPEAVTRLAERAGITVTPLRPTRRLRLVPPL